MNIEETACMPKQLTVYKASAGSGKTFTLATEYIKLLISNPQQYRNILAVTFTNKATEEMKLRILSQLYGIWKKLPSSDSYLKVICQSSGISPEIASKQAGIALQNLIHNYGYFRVETIDSFFQRVLRNLARELDLTANLRIGLNDGQVEEQAVDQLIEQLGYSDEQLQWIISYIEQNMQDDKSWNVIGQIKQFGKTIFQEYYKGGSKELNEKLATEGFFENYVKTIRKTGETARKRMENLSQCFFRELEMEGLTIDSLAGKERGIASYFRKLAGDDFSDKNCMNATLANHLESAENWAAKASKERATVIAVTQQTLMPILQQAEEERPKMWNLYVSARLTLRHLSQLRLLSTIERKVRELNADANRFLLSDTQQLLHELIDYSDSPFIFEKIGTQLEHVMIDEFQDTSTVQWANFKVLLEETMSRAHARNLIVGDVKQSIYRWRSGDWRLLNGIESQFQNPQQQLDVKNLDTNYRSCRNIIEFNNEFFKQAAALEYFREREINEYGAELLKTAYRDVTQNVPGKKGAEGLVHITLLSNNDDYNSIMMDAIGKQVDKLTEAGIPQNKMAILVRTNKYIPLIADYFMKTRPNIMIVSDEAFRLDASLAVTTLVNALQWLVHPNDPLVRTNVEKSYQKIACINGKGIQEGLPKVPLASEEVRKQLLCLPLTDIVERLFALLQLEKLANQSAYLCKFYDELNSFVQELGTDISGFLNEWDCSIHQKTIQSDQIDGIRLISIHKSKGLEFDNVIIPYCDWKLELGTMLWCVPEEKPFNGLPIVPIDYSGKLAETIYQKDYAHEHLQNCVDNLNLLYVAFTRASNNLFIIGKKDAAGTRSMLIQQTLSTLDMDNCIYEETDDTICFSFGNLYTGKEETGDKKETTKKGEEDALANSKESLQNVFLQTIQPIQIKMETFKNPVTFRQSNKSTDFVSEEDTHGEQNMYIKMGNIMHHLFSHIRTTDDIPAVLKQLEFDGVLYDDDIPADKIGEMLKRRLTDPRIAQWFSPQWQLFNECSIIEIDEKGNLCKRRPDRVMTDGKQTVVVDFKFGNPRPEHYGQVKEYINLLSRMGHPNVSGYLWFVYSNRIEQV